MPKKYSTNLDIWERRHDLIFEQVKSSMYTAHWYEPHLQTVVWQNKHAISFLYMRSKFHG